MSNTGSQYPKTVSFSQTIPFDQPLSYMAQHTITGALTFTKDTSGAYPGYGTMLRLVADGSHTPDFSDFAAEGPGTWDNTNGVVNKVFFYYDGTQYCYIVTQPGTGGTVSAPIVNGMVATDANTISVTFNMSVSGFNGFTFKQNGTPLTISGHTTPTSTVITYTITETMLSTDTLTADYTPGDIVNGSSVALASFTGQSITNSIGGLTPLSTPTLTATVISDTEIDLSWTNVSNESSYKLEWSPNGTSGWTQIGGTIAANTTTYNHTGLTASTHYYYRVTAVGDGVTYSDSGYGTDDDTTSAGGSYNADAQALFDAIAGGGGSVPTPQKSAWSNFIDGLVTDSLYSKFPLSTAGSALHPMLGSTQGSQKWNHCNPADTDGAHRLTGTGTFDAVGVKFNGSTQFLDTHIPVNTFAFSAGTIIFYVATRNNTSGGYFGGFISSFNTGLIGLRTTPDGSSSGTGLDNVGFFCNKVVGSLTFDPVGLWMITRDASGNGKVYKDGTLLYSGTGFNSDQGVTTSVYLGGLNKESTGLYNPSDCKLGMFAMCPNVFNDTEAANFNTRFQTFKTAASK